MSVLMAFVDQFVFVHAIECPMDSTFFQENTTVFRDLVNYFEDIIWIGRPALILYLHMNCGTAMMQLLLAIFRKLIMR